MKTKLYKWISMVGLTLFGASILTGCADDSFSAPDRENDNLISFAVAENTIFKTRAEKSDVIEDLTILVYDKTDKFQYKQTFEEQETQSNFYKSLNLSAISSLDGEVTFYAVTNCKEKLSSISKDDNSTNTPAYLQTITDDLTGDNLTMSASLKCKVSDVTKNENTFVLHRNSAKLSVGIFEHNELEPSFEILNVKVVNALPTTYITAYADNLNGTGSALTKSREGEFVYMAPKASTSDMSVVVEAKYNNASKSSWYRCSLKGKNPENFKKGDDFNAAPDKEISSILPNYWYQILIYNVVGPGFANEVDALNASVANMSVMVVDHAPKIYSLVSTGTHTLGVQDTMDIYETGQVTKDLLIKTICKEDATSCSVTSDPIVNVIQGKDWIELEGIATKTDTPDNGTANVLYSPSDAQFWNQKLIIKPLRGGDYREGQVQVEWGGLTRIVTIAQYGTFDGSAFGKFTISMENNPNDGDFKEDYFGTFLTSTAVGVDKNAMCGVVRNQGLHFPIGLKSSFDSNANLTTYEYTLSNIVPEFYGSYKIYVKKDSKFSGNIKVNGADATEDKKATGTFDNSTILKITNTSPSWEYIAESNALVVEITTGEEGNKVTTTFTYDLYQTGFFYKPSTESMMVSGETKNNYYYYEVIKVNTDGNDVYWLDRNMGATAAGVYIQGENGNAFPNQTAPFVEGSQGNLYGLTNEAGSTCDNKIVPPGFRIPTVSEFNSLTSSSIFIMQSTMTPVNPEIYWSSYFVDQKSKRSIYFPKNRYKQAGAGIVGDQKAGYYWTRSQAVGASGSEVGKWWQVVKISGGSASVNRFRAWDNDNSSAMTGLSVRAVKDEPVSEVLKTYKLTVNGYTHVYLYTINDKGMKVPLNNWPGDQILPYENSDQPIDYDFGSYLEYNNVFVILNKVNGNTVESSWSANSLTAEEIEGQELTEEEKNPPAIPSTDGKYVLSDDGESPWKTRVEVPGREYDSKYKKFTIYWKYSKMGENYDKLYVREDENDTSDPSDSNNFKLEEAKDGKKVSQYNGFYYIEYYTEDDIFVIAPTDGTYLWKAESDKGKLFWTINRNEMTPDSKGHYFVTLYTYDTDPDYLNNGKVTWEYAKPRSNY